MPARFAATARVNPSKIIPSNKRIGDSGSKPFSRMSASIASASASLARGYSSAHGWGGNSSWCSSSSVIKRPFPSAPPGGPVVSVVAALLDELLEVLDLFRDLHACRFEQQGHPIEERCRLSQAIGQHAIVLVVVVHGRLQCGARRGTPRRENARAAPPR